VIDWPKLQILKDLCDRLAVGFTLHYAEASGLFYVTISSAAPSEEWIGGDAAFAIAVYEAMDWLNSIALGRNKVDRP
jgi:hypothetical protein